MKRIFVLLCVAVFLGGCGATEKKESIAVTPTLAAETTPTPTFTQDVLIDGPTAATVIAPMKGGYIDAVALLQKLDEIGCTLDNITIREVKRGGLFTASCVVTDPLNMPADKL